MLKTLAKGVNYLFGKALEKNSITVSSSLGYLYRKRTIDKNYFDYIQSAANRMSALIEKAKQEGK